MNETNPQVPQQAPPAGDVTYQVMPHGGSVNMPVAPTPPSGGRSGSSKVAYIIIAIIVLLLLGGLAYYFLGMGSKETPNDQPTNQSKIPPSFISQYFAKDVCDDEASCGDSADPEQDGLSNYQEFVADTNPTIADTDGDGLADGDEVNIYGTSPKNKYTDTRAIAQQNDFNDGASIHNGYDPITPGDKYTQTKLMAIQTKIAQFSLHAPSTTTLKLNTNGTPVSQ